MYYISSYAIGLVLVAQMTPLMGEETSFQQRVDFCSEKTSFMNMRDMCFYSFIRTSGDQFTRDEGISFCNIINNKNLVPSCLSLLAIELEDPSVCEEIKDDNYNYKICQQTSGWIDSIGAN